MNSGDGTLGRHPFVVAHRGASADRPEHTLAAYELALAEGADGVEENGLEGRDKRSDG